MRTKKIFVLVILTFCLLLTGCGAKMESASDVSNESMFVLIEKGAYYKLFSYFRSHERQETYYLLCSQREWKEHYHQLADGRTSRTVIGFQYLMHQP